MIDPADLQDQPRWWLLPAFEQLQFKPGRGAYPLSHKLLSGRIQERQVESVAGDVFEVTLSAVIRNLRSEVDYLRAKISNRRLHVVGITRSGQQRFVPHMKFSIAADTGDRSNQNAYTVQGAARLWRPAPLVELLSPVVSGTVIPPVTNPPVTGGSVSITEVTVTGSTYTYSLPAGKLLLCVYAKGSSGQTLLVGTTSGGYDLSGPLEITANTWALLGDNLWHADSSTPIYISGLQGTNTLKFYIL